MWLLKTSSNGDTVLVNQIYVPAGTLPSAPPQEIAPRRRRYAGHVKEACWSDRVVFLQERSRTSLDCLLAWRAQMDLSFVKNVPAGTF